jgi:hypothetical protein
MPYTPFANTDQGLATLGKALFPDPAVIAQTGYYGAAQREKMLSGNKLIDQGNAANQVLGLTDDSGVSYAPPTFSVPPNSPAGAPAVMNSPAGLPVVPPAGGAPSLSGTVTTPAPGPVPSPPTQAAPAPPAGGGTVDAGSGFKVADTVINNSNGADPPIPGVHPGTFQAPGGGIKQAPPAAHDGSPAPLVNPSLFINMGVRAGYDASQLQVMGNAYVMQKVRSGQIDQKTGEDWMSGFGQAALVQARTSLATNAATNAANIQQENIRQAGETGRTGMTNATTLAQENIRQAGDTSRKQMDIAAAVATARAVPFRSQPGGPGTQVITTTTGEAVDKGLQPFDQASDTAARTLINVQTNGPASPPTAMRQGEVPTGTPVFNQNVYDNATKPISVVDAATKQPATIRYQDYLDAPPGKYIYNPASKEISPLEALQRKSVYDKVVQDAYPGVPPTTRVQGTLLGPRNEKARLNPADDVTYTERANQYYTYGPAGVRGDPYAAGQLALKDLQQEGVIRKSVDRTSSLDVYNPHIVEYATEKGPVQYYRVPSLQEEPEPLKNTVAPTTSAPATSAPAATPAAAAPATPAAAPGTSAMSAPTLGAFVSRLFGGGTPSATAPAAAAPAPTPQAAGAIPPGAINVAPPGTTEGQVVYGNAGTTGVVRGGFVYPAQASPEMGR